MQVVQTAGAPPNPGNMYFPRRSCTQKSKNALRKIVSPNEILPWFGRGLTATLPKKRDAPYETISSVLDNKIHDARSIKGIADRSNGRTRNDLAYRIPIRSGARNQPISAYGSQA